MFWGLIMEPGKKYSQTVEKSFHVSQAALDLDSAQNHPVQVLLGFENRNYLLCTLNKDKWVQVPLDLNFQVGDKVSFATNGPGHVHLTGYLVPEDDYDMDLEEEEDEEEQEDEEVPELLPISNKKRKADIKLEQTNKKIKSETLKLLEESFPNDSDEDDSDVNLSDLIENEASDEEIEEEEDGAEEEDDEDDDDSEDVEEEEEEQQPVQIKKEKPKQNGIVKPEKQKGDKQKSNKQEKQSPGKQEKQSPKQKGSKKTLQGGVTIEDLKVGEGTPATTGRQLVVYYEGKLQSNNKIFDSSKKGNGFKFRLGKQEVIKGWDVGVAGMKVGGKRRITCPPHMAYGAQGSPPVIPPQSTLVFDIELKHLK